MKIIERKEIRNIIKKEVLACKYKKINKFTFDLIKEKKSRINKLINKYDNKDNLNDNKKKKSFFL